MVQPYKGLYCKLNKYMKQVFYILSQNTKFFYQGNATKTPLHQPERQRPEYKTRQMHVNYPQADV